jgi:hypothetical protein
LSLFWFLHNIRGSGNVYKKGECQVGSFKFPGSDRRGPIEQPPASNFTLHTSNRSACETNPIGPGRRDKCAKRTQSQPPRKSVGRGRPTYEEAERAKRTQFPRLRIADWGLQIGKGRLRADAGGKMRKTNPIWTGQTWGARTGVSSVELRVSGQKGPPCCPLTSNFTLPHGNYAKRSQTWRDWDVWAKAVSVWGVVRPGVKRAKRTQFPDCGLEEAGSGRMPEAKCAKRTQFRSAEQHVGQGCPTPDQVGGGLYEEPKRAKRTQFGPAGTGDEGKCAKRSQTWRDRGIWAKAVVWGVVRPGVERAKRTQFGPAGGQDARNEPNLHRPDMGCPDGGVKCGAVSVRSERFPMLPSDFKPQTSHFPTRKRAKRTQFPAGWAGFFL